MRTAVYAGSFDPPTMGHLSVIERAAGMFDRVIVLVAVNDAKQALFTLEERLALVAAATAHLGAAVSVAATRGYVVEHARAAGATVLVRGLRGATDADYETTLAAANRALAPELTTIFVPAHPELSDVSSTRLKALAAAGEDVAPWCPPGVEVGLLAKYPRPTPPPPVPSTTSIGQAPKPAGGSEP